MKDKHGQKLAAGDYVKAWGSFFIICEKGGDAFMQIVCDPGHPCHNIPYAFTPNQVEKVLQSDVVPAKALRE